MLTIKKQVSKKKQIIELIKKNLRESSAVIFYNFSHSENEETFHLKKKLREIEGEWFVCKNTLFKKALGDDKIQIKGNNAFIFCRGDQYKPLKILRDFDFRKNFDNRIQGGIYQGKLIDQAVLNGWANLKSKENHLNDFCNLLFFNIVGLTALIDGMMKIDKE